jgi:hypothetical protein
MLMYVFVHSRSVENPPIGSWETNPCFFRGGGGSLTTSEPLISLDQIIFVADFFSQKSEWKFQPYHLNFLLRGNCWSNLIESYLDTSHSELWQFIV